MDNATNEKVTVFNYEFQKADLMLIPVSLLIGYLFQVLVLFGNLSLGVVLFELCAYSAVFWYVHTARIKADMSAKWISLCVVLLNIPFILYDFTSFRAVYLIFTVLFTAYHIFSILGLKKGSILSDLFNSCVTWPIANMNCSAHAISAATKRSKGKTIITVICGLLISAVIVSVLAALLISADAAFENMSNIISDAVLNKASLHVIYLLLGIPFAMIVYGMLYGGRVGRNCDLVKPIGADKFKLIPTTFTLAVFIPIVILYILYIVSQGAYLFSPFSGLLPNSFTYAEYARRGFFELCAISVINIILLIALNVFAKAEASYAKMLYKLINIFICAVSFIMISTAIAKMFMYIAYYGLSVKRTYTTIFMLSLGIVFILILIKNIRKKFDIVKYTSIILSVMIIASSYIDVDRLTAAYNLNAYENGCLPNFDYEMLLNMSDSTLPYVLEYVNNSTGSDHYSALISYEQKAELIEDNGLTLTGFNFSTLEVLRVIRNAHLE